MKKLSHLFLAIIFLDVTTGVCQITTFHGAESPGPFIFWDGHMKGNSIARTKDGKYVVGGVIDESGLHGRPYVLKSSVTGTNAWQRIYLGEHGTYSGKVLSLREYGAGGIVATGHIMNGGWYHTLFLKIGPNGNTLVTKGFRFYADDFGTCIQVVRNASGTPSGTVLTGISSPGGGFVHVTDANGEPLATTLIANSITRWVVQTPDGFLVLGGNFENSELHLFKFTSDLTLLWSRAYRPIESGSSIYGTSITQVGSVIYVTGTISGSALLMQLNTDGTFNWARTYGSNSISVSLATKKEVNGVGGLYLTGKVRSTEQDRAYILNTDLNGNRRWSKVYHLEIVASEGREIITTADSLVVTGANGDNMFLIRTDPQGLSGGLCEYSVAMQATTQAITETAFNVTFRSPHYEELKSTFLDKFNVMQAFCNWDTTIPPHIGDLDPSVVVYPTVVSSAINIELKSPSDAEGSVALFDVNKKLQVQAIPPGTSNVTLHVSHLAPGLYYLLISTNGKETTAKFIKQ
ncbi:T9SS type A sorting domain-containing protein [Chryseolinea sp. H1M3-3]|uniref:T9SS type A sorting domain-containing protein n=1 Tax=Chryseolinea sp. H1M3-3 TaxID=3034144 RepID=UPI0023EBBA5A|nr:T9SS type A sorting domain-containing protein [Chryseolinea sp. H1M3-3]